MNKKTFALLFFTIVLPLSLFGLGAWQYQNISDYIRLIDYQPPARIAQIRDDITLTKEGETLFYVHKPQIVDSSDFLTSCPVFEKTIVLGCYYSNTSIYIFDVDDSRVELQGVEEVTAAHEILHAAYDRLNQSEKEWLRSLLYQAYDTLEADSKVKQNIEEYNVQGETVVLNELHSIIGTEVEELPQELEDYYARYFKDRSAIVKIAKQYGQVFRTLEEEIDKYDARLQTLSSEITELESRITNYQADLNRRSQELNGLKNDPPRYNEKVEEYNAIVRQYNSIVESYKEKIEQYNTIVNQRNAISAEQTSLYDAIDARVEEVEE